MLLTDVWEAMEYLALEPPAHLLLRPVAHFFGYQFHEESATKPQGGAKAKPQPSTAEIASLMQVGQRGGELPAYIRNSPSFQKMIAEMGS